MTAAAVGCHVILGRGALAERAIAAFMYERLVGVVEPRPLVFVFGPWYLRKALNQRAEAFAEDAALPRRVATRVVGGRKLLEEEEGRQRRRERAEAVGQRVQRVG